MRCAATVSLWIAACLLLPSTTIGAPHRSSFAARAPARVEPMELLPRNTLLMVELRDASARWGEIRDLPAVARFQDRMLAPVGLQADDLRLLLGDLAVLALVADPSLAEVAPVAILRPASSDDASRALQRLLGLGAVPLEAEWTGDVVTVVPAAFRDHLGPPSAERPSALRERMRTTLVDARLPEGGLVRGWFDPELAVRVLESRAGDSGSFVAGLAMDLISAELEAMRFAGFRRDVTATGIVTDAVIGYDSDALPREVRAVFRAPDSPRVLPAAPVPGTIGVAAFGTEADSLLPWLRHVSKHHPHGAFRNLEFWIDELEGRTGLDVDRDVFDLLGERAWLTVSNGAGAGGPWQALVVEVREAERLERNLLAIHDWAAEQVAGRTLGLARPRIEDVAGGAGVEHRLSVLSPLGEMAGPRFVFERGCLILGYGDAALEAGRHLRSVVGSSPVRTGGASLPPGPNQSLRIDGSELAQLFASLARFDSHGDGVELLPALIDLASELDHVAVDAWFETDTVRIHGSVEFRPSTRSR